MGKEKKSTASPAKMDVDSPAKDDGNYEIKAQAVTPISHPLASKKLNKKLLKVVKKGIHTLFCSRKRSNVI